MKYILLASLMGITICTHAQALKHKKAAKFDTRIPKDSVSAYRDKGKVYIYQDKSDKISFLGQLNIANIEAAQGDIAKWIMGVGADYYFKKFVGLHGEYNVALFDYQKLMSDNPNQTNLSVNSVSRFHSYDAGVRVFISDKAVHRKHKIIVARRHSMSYDIYYYILPKLPCREIVALRAGAWGYNSIVTTDMNSTLKDGNGNGAVKAEDGTILGSTYFTNAFTSGGYIGISRVRMFHTVTKNSYKKGVYLSKAVNELYADLLIASTTFDPIIDSNGAHKIKANASGSFQTLPVGARIGIKCSKENRGIGYEKVELGYRPGLKNNGWYLNLGMSFALIK